MFHLETDLSFNGKTTGEKYSAGHLKREGSNRENREWALARESVSNTLTPQFPVNSLRAAWSAGQPGGENTVPGTLKGTGQSGK